MEVDCLLAQADPEEVHPICAESTRKPPDATTLGRVDRVYWVVRSRRGTDLDGNEFRAISCHQIELAIEHFNVRVADSQTVD